MVEVIFVIIGICGICLSMYYIKVVVVIEVERDCFGIFYIVVMFGIVLYCFSMVYIVVD